MLLATIACAALHAQDLPPPMPEVTEQNPNAPCLQPPELMRIQDYEGPFRKLVGTLGSKVERRSVHEYHYKPGVALCSLEPHEKFNLFVHDTLEPVSFLSVGLNAGLAHAQNLDPSYGGGGLGYAQRFGAELADQTTSRFFSSFVYPSLFSEDPRYYRLGHGSFQRRFFHALEHVVVAHRDSGRHMFNFSEWAGTSTAVAIGYTYHPNNPPGAGAAAWQVGQFVLTDAGFDVLREFWPEIARKFRLPFRGVDEPVKKTSERRME